MADGVKVTIDDIDVTVPKGTFLIQAAKSAGIYISAAETVCRATRRFWNRADALWCIGRRSCADAARPRDI